MYNSQYYTCEQIDQRLLQGYLDDYNTQTGQSLTKAQFLTKLGNIFSKEGVIDNISTQIGYYECDTAAGTAAKVITVANYALFVGGSIKVKFLNRNTAGIATLNINSQGAKTLYYGGKAVSASNSWDNNEIVEIYYDGTSYYANNVEGNFKDGIFDISSYNLTEGQPTKYATLAEALGTNGANVPAIFRKGGMQIKYVSTSDNKYVQYRLMSDTFNTTVTNWQGVDDEPTAGSDNLVKSRGVEYSSHFSDFIFTPLNNNSIGFTSNQDGSVDVVFKRASYICITDNGRHDFNVARPSESINIPSAHTLVYDFTDSTVKVVALNNTTFAQPPILLAMVNNGIIERGVLAQAWLEQKIDANKESITEVNDNVAFGDYAIYPSYKSAVYGEINVSDQSVDLVFTRNRYIVIGSKGNTQQFNINVEFDADTTSKTYNVPPQQALVYNRVTSALEVVGLNNVNYSKDCIILLSNSSNYKFTGYFAANVNEVYQPLIGKGVLFIGDSITEYGQGDQSVQNHFIDEFQKLTGCEVYNRGAAGTTIANYKDGDDSQQYAFCGKYSFCSRLNFPEDNTLNWVANGGFPNYSKINLVVLFGGTNDWCRRTTHQGSFGDVNGAIDQTTYCGAIRYMLRMLKYKYSKPILVLSPMHIFSATQGQEHWNEIIYGGNGSESNAYTIQQSNTTGSIGKSLYDYIGALQELSRLYGCHFVNMQDVGFTSVIAQDRNAFTHDGLHPNDRGGKIMAQYILDAIKSKVSL